MTDEQKRISIEANVAVGEQAGGAATGVSVGGSATVNVNLERLVEEPPQTIRDYIKSLWLLTLADQLERRERQAETDRHRQQLTSGLRAHGRWLVALTTLVVVNSAVILVWIWQWTERFGWWW